MLSRRYKILPALALIAALLLQSAAMAQKMKLIYHYANHGVGVISFEEACKSAKDIGGNAIVILSPSDGNFASLESSLDAAEKHDLDVMIMCNRRYLPYKSDLVKWSEKYAEISLKHPNFVAWTMVDFMGGVDPAKPETYLPSVWKSPDAVKAATAAKNSINPKLKFLPELYFDAHLKTGEMVYFEKGNPYYRAFTDGAQFFLWTSYDDRRTLDLGKLADYISTANSIVSPAYYVPGVYAVQGGKYKHPDMAELHFDPDTVYKMVKMCLDNSPGVTVYALSGPLLAFRDPDALLQDADRFAQPENDNASFSFKLGSKERAVMGWYHEIVSDVSLPRDVSVAKLSFNIKDTDLPNSSYAAKFAQKQILVNGKVVWEKGVYEDDRQATPVSQDLTSHLKGQTSAQISIRMQGKCGSLGRDYVYVGDISLVANGQAVKTDFQFKSGIRDLDKWVATYQAVKRALNSDPPQ